MSDPREFRMKQALELTAMGRSQAEIGKLLNCAPRTVRDLLKEGRDRRLITFRTRSAEDVMSDVEHKVATLYARLSSAWARAKNAGNLKAEVAILARMDQALVSRVAMLARVGFFDQATFNTGATGNEADKQAKRDREQLDGLLSLSAALNRGEDLSLLRLPTDDDADPFDVDNPLY